MGALAMTDLDAVSVGEAARILRASVGTIRIWIKKKILRTYKTPGGHHRVLVTSIRDLQEQRAREVSDD